MPEKNRTVDHKQSPLCAMAGVLALCAVAYRLMVSASLGGFFGNGVADLVIFLAVVAYMVSMIRPDAPPLRMNLASAAFVLFLLVYLISAKTSHYPRAGVETLMNLAALACLLLLVSGTIFSQDDSPCAASYLVALAALPIAIGIFQYTYEFPQMLKEGVNLPGWVGRVYVDEKSAADFITRIQTMRVFAAFFTPNVFAGYLALMIPVTLGLGAAVVRGTASRRAKVASGAVVLILAAAEVFLLVLTKSKAGVAAGGFALGIFALFALYRLLPRKAFIAVVLIAILVFGSIPVLAGISRTKQLYHEAVTSFGVRMGYWTATWRMVEASPLRGIGPGNFSEVYVGFKGIGERDVRDPHNAYLLTWAEGGVFCLLFFAAFWVLVFAGPGQRAVQRRCPTTRAGILAVAAALVLYLVVEADLYGPDLELTATVVGGAAASIVLVGLLMRAARLADPAFARAGLAAGLAGFLLHSAVDVNFSDAGAATVAVFAAAALSPRGKAAVLYGGRRGAVLFALLASVCFLLFVWRIFVPYGQAEFALAEARDFLWKGDHPAARERALTAAALDRSSVAPPMFMAEVYRTAAAGEGANSSNFNLAESFYQQVLKLNPGYWPAHERLARLYEAAGPDFYAKALCEYADLLLMYPANIQYQVRAAVLLEKTGHYADALKHYREALNIDDETEEHGQQLSTEERARVRESIERVKVVLRSQGINPDW